MTASVEIAVELGNRRDRGTCEESLLAVPNSPHAYVYHYLTHKSSVRMNMQSISISPNRALRAQYKPDHARALEHQTQHNTTQSRKPSDATISRPVEARSERSERKENATQRRQGEWLSRLVKLIGTCSPVPGVVLSRNERRCGMRAWWWTACLCRGGAVSSSSRAPRGPSSGLFLGFVPERDVG